MVGAAFPSIPVDEVASTATPDEGRERRSWRRFQRHGKEVYNLQDSRANIETEQ